MKGNFEFSQFVPNQDPEIEHLRELASNIFSPKLVTHDRSDCRGGHLVADVTSISGYNNDQSE